MSIVITNGYKIKASSLDEVIKIIKKYKPKIAHESYKHLVKQELSHSIEALFDYICSRAQISARLNLSLNCAPSAASDSGSTNALALGQDIVQEVKKADPRFKNNYLIIYPQAVKIDNNTHYLLTAHLPSSVEAALNGIGKKFSEYGYWNHSDAPEHLSQRQWSQRKQHWGKVMQKWNPTMSGLELKIIEEEYGLYLLSPEELEHLQREVIEELNRDAFRDQIIKNKLVELSMEHMRSANGEHSPLQEMGNLYSLIRKINQNELSAEQIEFKQRAKDLLEHILPRAMTLELLKTPLEDIMQVYGPKIELESHLSTSSSLAKPSLKAKI